MAADDPAARLERVFERHLPAILRGRRQASFEAAAPDAEHVKVKHAGQVYVIGVDPRLFARPEPAEKAPPAAETAPAASAVSRHATPKPRVSRPLEWSAGRATR